METIRYYYFIDLADTLNFTETAEHFYTTQSNISKQIKALELFLDVRLFERKHRQITLTPAGNAFLPYAKKLTAIEKEAFENLKPFQEEDTNILHISAIPIMTTYQIPQILASFKKNYPSYNIIVKEIESVFIADELKTNQCDVAFCRIFDATDYNPHSYEMITIKKDYFVVVLPVNHPLASKKILSFSDLNQENFYQLNQNTYLMQQFHSLCKDANFTPNIIYEGTRIDNILDFIRNQLGISILMRYSLPEQLDKDICFRPLEITKSSELVFLRKKEKIYKKSIQSFWQYLKTLHSQ